MKRIDWQLILACIIVAAVMACLGYVAFAQPPQPGDIPAPVVDGPDVFETGILSASITCPPTVQAGSVLVLDVSGSSEGTRELIIRPTVPSGALQWDSGGSYAYLWIARRGNYVALWVVSSGKDISTDTVAFEVVEGEVPPDPDEPDDVPPEDIAFTIYVRELLEKVEADTHSDVSEIFLGIAKRIDAGELKTSRPIEVATVRALFGEAAEMNPQWSGFWLDVWGHMLDDLRLSSPKQWAEHFREIAEVLKR